MSEVVLLGTGSADGWPNPFCRCPSCTRARSRGELRSPTSVLVDDVLLLDCGPETARAAGRAQRVLDQVHTILLTHEHPDHCDPSLLLWRGWARVGHQLDVVGPAAALQHWRQWCAPEDPVRFVEVGPGDRIACGEYAVRVLEANHVPGAVIYDVTCPDGSSILYATDTGALPEATVEAMHGRGYELVLLEETFGDAGHLGAGHHDLPGFAATVTRLRAVGAITELTEVVAIHLGHHNPPEPELGRRLASSGAVALPDLAVIDVRPGGRAGARPDSRTARRVLVTGGARSGKSAVAESLVDPRALVTYVATAPRYDGDAEWEERIATHRARRPDHWRTIELTDAVELATLLDKAGADDVLLIDCLTLWLTRAVDEHAAWDDASRRGGVDTVVDQFLDAWTTTQARVVLVTNEVGSGVVPPTASGRYFRDLLGALNARTADLADEVRLVVAGRSVTLP